MIVSRAVVADAVSAHTGDMIIGFLLVESCRTHSKLGELLDCDKVQVVLS